jgi:hypothetical protein
MEPRSRSGSFGYRLELVTALRVSYREQQRASAVAEALCCSREDVARPGLDILDLGEVDDDVTRGSVASATAIKYATSLIRLISLEELSLGISCSFAVADDGAD